MHGLGDENARIVRSELKEERRAILHHRNELLVTDPGRVKENVVAQASDAVHHLTGVIDGAVIGAKLNHSAAEGSRRIGLFGRNLSHAAAQLRLVKARIINAADKPIRIARCFQIHRTRTGKHQRP